MKFTDDELEEFERYDITVESTKHIYSIMSVSNDMKTTECEVKESYNIRQGGVLSYAGITDLEVLEDCLRRILFDIEASEHEDI